MPKLSRFVCAALILLGLCAAASAAALLDLIVCDLDSNLARDATVEASSAASEVYGAASLTDNRAETTWATAGGAPLPQWVHLSFDHPRTLDTLVIVNRGNPRHDANPRHVEISFGEGEPLRVELPDRAGAHIIRLPERTAEWLRLTVVDVWEDSVYVALSELMAFSDPGGAIRLAQRPQADLREWQQLELTESGRAEHPCVYMTRDDVQRARQLIEQHDWARSHAQTVISRADEVVGHSAEWIREHTPERGACFACGKGSCPVCGARWTKSDGWGGWASLDCSFDRPGTVKCANGHLLPNEQFPDPGTGHATDDGRVLYFVGSYNSWVVENYMLWCSDLAFAYTVTGEERYAGTCAALLDALAEIYPYCTAGSWDYPSDPPSGRLARPWYQVARYLVPIVEAYDQIYHSAALDEPSFVEGMRRRDNIETSMLKDGARYCYEQSQRGGLHNGEADYIRGALAVGCLLGIEEYIDWAVDGPYGIRAMIRNNADRDGRYFETSLMYALHARSLYLTFAEPLVNYRSKRYPEGINLYDDPGFRAFYVVPALSMDLLGHSPRYGDTGPDTRRSWPPAQSFNVNDYRYAERIYRRTTLPDVREAFGSLLNLFAGGDLERLRGGSGDADWLIFHAGAEETLPDRPLDADLRRLLRGSHNMGQKGIAMMRTSPSSAAQACLLRYGPSLNHGHLDDLNINYVALGYELTYDLGYGDGATPTQQGWAKQTAAHNLVMVDESTQLSGEGDDSGGSLHLFAGMPGLQIVDADADAVYHSRGVEQYRRFLALVGDGPGSYLLDIFRVAGGTQHDYLAHALSDDASFDGVSLGAPAEGSLAGVGTNWGERQMADGYLEGTLHARYSNPVPGNGLGFMMHPRRATTDEPWSVTWRLPDGDSFLRMHMLDQPGTAVISTWAPGIFPRYPRAAHVVARRRADGTRLESTFVSVREPYGPLQSADSLRGIDLLAAADSDDGALKHLPGLDIVLFQAREFGGEARFRLQLADAGRYWIRLQPWRSPSYSAATFSLDGNPIGERFVGTAPEVGPGPVLTLGPIELTAGEHTLGLTTVRAGDGEPWISLRSIELADRPEEPEAGRAAPFIEQVRRILASAGATALEVKQVNGVADRLVYAGTPDEPVKAGDLVLDGCFGHLRENAGRVVAAHLIGKSLSAPGFRLELAHGEHAGQIARIDYEHNLVYVDADLPTDGRLRFQTVVFDSPDYSRDTSYTIHDVRRQGDLSVIDLGRQRIILGEGMLDQAPPSPTRLTSLTPHHYARPTLFTGKGLASADFRTVTQVQRVQSGQPFIVDVRSSEGFQVGDRFYYLDLRPGDRFVIRNWATLTIAANGSARVVATDDVRLTLDGARAAPATALPDQVY